MSKKLLRKKLALMLANLKKKRPYYCEVEWIKSSTNNCAINTGIYPDMATIKVECRAIKFTSASLFGEIDINERFNLTGSGPNNYCYYGNSSSQVGAYAPVDASLPYTFVLDRGTFYLDGVQKGGSLPDTTGTAQYPIALFCRFNNSSLAPNDSGIHTIYYCKIWNGGRLVRDFIPVLDWEYTPCFYDKVSGQLFYNQGTGTFAVGRQIIPVEYLESTGTQYIDTGVVANGEFDSQYKIFLPNGYTTNCIIAGARSSTQHINFGQFETNGRFTLAYLGNYWVGIASIITSNKYYDVEISYKSGSQTCKINGTSVTGASYTGTEALNMNIYLFKRNFYTSGDPTALFIGKLYYFQLWQNGKLVRDFIPAIDENDTFFMFDKITHTAYNNAGSGSFIGPTVQKDGNGKIIENEYE